MVTGNETSDWGNHASSRPSALSTVLIDRAVVCGAFGLHWMDSEAQAARLIKRMHQSTRHRYLI